MADQEKTGVVIPFKAVTRQPPVRKPFVPLTGNPENGVYADYFNYLCEGEEPFGGDPPKRLPPK